MEEVAVCRWFRGIPPELDAVVEHVCGKCAAVLEQYADPTADMCSATLYQNPIGPLVRYNAIILQELRQNLPRSVIGKFDQKLEYGTPGAIIAAYYALFVAAAEQAICPTFDELLEIATQFGSRLEAPPLAWTQVQLRHFVQDTAMVTDWWVKRACIDKSNCKPDEEYRLVEGWRAPRYVQAACATEGDYVTLDHCNRPTDPWKRMSVKESAVMVRSPKHNYVYRLESTIKRLSGDFAVKLAKEGKPMNGDCTPNATEGQHEHACLRDPDPGENLHEVFEARFKKNQLATCRTDEAAKFFEVSTRTIGTWLKDEKRLLRRGPLRGTLTVRSVFREMARNRKRPIRSDRSKINGS